MSIPDPCVDREALGALVAPYGAFCFLIDVLGDPGPVPAREAYRGDVKETIAWHPGYREVVKLVYHGLTKSVTFLSTPLGRGTWAGLEPEQMKELGEAAGYTVGNFVQQFHPCDPLRGYPVTWGSTNPAIVRLKAEPGFVERLPLLARLMLAVATTRVYPDRTCVVGLCPDDAYVAACARRLLGAEIDFMSAQEFFARVLRPEVLGAACACGGG